MKRDKKGWMVIVEAFIAVMLIVVVLLVFVQRENTKNQTQENVYRDQLNMVGEIKSNQSLRASILGINSVNLPINSDNPLFPQDVKKALDKKKPSYLTCKAQICLIEQSCVISDLPDKEIYAFSSAIFSDPTKYSPRKIVISCFI